MKHSSNTYMHILIFNWCAQTSRLPNLTYHYMLRFIKKKSLKMQKLLNYQWMMIYMFHISFLIVLKTDQNYQNTSETFIKQVHAYMNFQLQWQFPNINRKLIYLLMCSISFCLTGACFKQIQKENITCKTKQMEKRWEMNICWLNKYSLTT